MHKKLLIHIFMASLVTAPVMRAEDARFWDKPENRALVITGASVCVALLAILAYSYKQKSVSSSAGSTPPPSDSPVLVVVKPSNPLVIVGEGSDSLQNASEYLCDDELHEHDGMRCERCLAYNALKKNNCDSESDDDADAMRDMPNYMHDMTELSLEMEADQKELEKLLS